MLYSVLRRIFEKKIKQTYLPLKKQQLYMVRFILPPWIAVFYNSTEVILFGLADSHISKKSTELICLFFIFLSVLDVTVFQQHGSLNWQFNTVEMLKVHINSHILQLDPINFGKFKELFTYTSIMVMFKIKLL